MADASISGTTTQTTTRGENLPFLNASIDPGPSEATRTRSRELPVGRPRSMTYREEHARESPDRLPSILVPRRRERTAENTAKASSKTVKKGPPGYYSGRPPYAYATQ